MKVLIVEDEPKLAALVRRGLHDDGVVADIAATGEDALWMAGSSTYDAIVLDVMLPGVDGLAVCRTLRGEGNATPILMLTARGSSSDLVAGLDGGADDYLTKPFRLDELSARLRAIARRTPLERGVVLRAGDLSMDPATREVRRGDTAIDLSPREYALLHAFLRRPGRVLERVTLLDLVWEHGYENRSNVVDAYVRYLRRKIDRPFGVDSIETVRGVGYRLDPDGGRGTAPPGRLP